MLHRSSVAEVFVTRDTRASPFGNWFHLTKLAGWGSALCAAAGLCVVPACAQKSAQQAPSKQRPATQAQKYPELPAGVGRDTLIRICGKCHSPQNVVADGQSQQGWEDTISKMAAFGATGTDDDFNAILDYLVTNFPPSAGVKVKVNEATAKELESGLGLSTTEAEAIIQYREKN